MFSNTFLLVPIPPFSSQHCTQPYLSMFHFVVQNSRIAVIPKPKLSPPQLPAAKDQDPGLGFLGWLGVVALIGGGTIAVVRGACCWIRNISMGIPLRHSICLYDLHSYVK